MKPSPATSIQPKTMSPTRLSFFDIDRLGVAHLDTDEPEDIWAILEERGWEVLGSGSCAVVAVLPGDPSRVLRISLPQDGWIGHTLAVQGEAHAPRLHALGWHEGLWFAISERLDPVPPEMSIRVITGLIGAVRHAQSPAAARPDFGALERRWPGLWAFSQAHLVHANDLTADNMMMRGGTLVVNDPRYLMPGEVAEGLAAEWQVLPEDEAELLPEW